MEKVKNKFESNRQFSEIHYLNKATDLAYYELLGDVEAINQEVEKYRAVSQADVVRVATDLFKPENCSTMYYCKK